jgi:hypothetical protein
MTETPESVPLLEQAAADAAPESQLIDTLGFGTLGADVWPIYVGLAESTSETIIREPIGDMDYDRGMINWVNQPDGTILGHGRVNACKGVYTHIIFAAAPVEGVMGVTKMEHPIIFDRSGFVDISPINNQDYLPR